MKNQQEPCPLGDSKPLAAKCKLAGDDPALQKTVTTFTGDPEPQRQPKAFRSISPEDTTLWEGNNPIEES